MDNAMVMAGHERALSRRLLGRLAVFTLGVGLVFTLAMVLLVDRANAQINIGQIVCPILLNLRNTLGGIFGGFVTPIINSLLAAFGCVVSGG